MVVAKTGAPPTLGVHLLLFTSSKRHLLEPPGTTYKISFCSQVLPLKPEMPPAFTSASSSISMDTPSPTPGPLSGPTSELS